MKKSGPSTQTCGTPHQRKIHIRKMKVVSTSFEEVSSMTSLTSAPAFGRAGITINFTDKDSEILHSDEGVD
jgi:hypothetical protein